MSQRRGYSRALLPSHRHINLYSTVFAFTTANLPDVPWAANHETLTWALLTELEKPENNRVLFGKTSKKENTSGDNKAAVCRRIAKAIIPDFATQDLALASDRIKNKIYVMTKIYLKHAKRLQGASSGVCYDETSDNSEQSQLLEFYINVDGPNANTLAEVQNIWGM